MTSCTELAPLLVARPLGVLEAHELAELDRHVSTCTLCRDRAARVDGVLAPTAPPEDVKAPAGQWARVAQRIEDASAAHARAPRITVKLSCTYCHESLVRDRAAYCAACLAPHHEECFDEHGRCSAPGCSETRTVAPRGRAARSAEPRVPVFAVVAAVLVAGVAALAMRSPEERRPASVSSAGDSVEVCVARADLERDTIVTQAHIALDRIPRKLALKLDALALADVESRTLVSSVRAGTVFVRAHFESKRQADALREAAELRDRLTEERRRSFRDEAERKFLLEEIERQKRRSHSIRALFVQDEVREEFARLAGLHRYDLMSSEAWYGFAPFENDFIAKVCPVLDEFPDETMLRRYELLVLSTEVKTLSKDARTSIVNFVRGGGGLVIVAGSEAHFTWWHKMPLRELLPAIPAETPAAVQAQRVEADPSCSIAWSSLTPLSVYPSTLAAWAKGYVASPDVRAVVVARGRLDKGRVTLTLSPDLLRRGHRDAKALRELDEFWRETFVWTARGD